MTGMPVFTGCHAFDDDEDEDPGSMDAEELASAMDALEAASLLDDAPEEMVEDVEAREEPSTSDEEDGASDVDDEPGSRDEDEPDDDAPGVPASSGVDVVVVMVQPNNRGKTSAARDMEALSGQEGPQNGMKVTEGWT